MALPEKQVSGNSPADASPTHARTLPGVHPLSGGPHQPRVGGTNDCRDGLGTTLLVVEIANSGIHWMEPRDLHVSQMSRTINGQSGQGISSGHQGLACVALADGRARVMTDKTPRATIDALLTIRGGETIPDDY